MTGGTLDDLNQGGSLDIFRMLGGHLTGTVTAGDFGFQSGGRIGAVNLQAADNGYHMLGGTIDRFLYAQTGDDYFQLEGGTIGFDPVGGTAGAGISINTGAGDDKVILDGALVEGSVVLFNPNNPQAETDFLELRSGRIEGQVLLGDGSDMVLVGRNFASQFSDGVVGGIDAGDGVSSADGWIDVLATSGWSGRLTGAGITNFETLIVSNGSVGFTDSSFTAGTDTGTGVFVLDGGELDFGSSFTLNANLHLGGAPTVNFTATTYDFTANPNPFYTIDTALYDLRGPADIVFSTDGGTLLAGGIGPYRVNGDVSNAGRIDLRGSGTGTRLRIAGDYVGAGGTLLINTTLGDDTSSTDQLIVEGNTAGSSLLRVNNTGGAGSRTNEGIKVIDVMGANSDGQFILIGDQIANGQEVLVVGAYYYSLHQGSASNPGDGDWYLRSRGVSVGPTEPLYQAAVPVIEIYPQILLGLNNLPTLQQRLGNRFWSGAGAGIAAEGSASQDEPLLMDRVPALEGRGIWGFLEGTHAAITPSNSNTVSDYDYDLYRVQAGVDLPLREMAAGMLVGGINAQFDRASADVTSEYGGGSIATTGLGLGGTLTWYGTEGFYLDSQAKVAWYESDLNSDQLGQIVSGSDGFGYALSLEGGQRLAVQPGLTFTPQAQLVYSSVDFDDFDQLVSGRPAAQISLLDGESLVGRIGLAIDSEASWQAENGTLSRRHIYGVANLYYEFLDGTQVDISEQSFATESERFWGGVGVGGSYNWNDDKYSIFGEGSVNTALADFGESFEVSGKVGVRFKW